MLAGHLGKLHHYPKIREKPPKISKPQWGVVVSIRCTFWKHPLTATRKAGRR